MPLYDPIFPIRYVMPLLDFIREQRPDRIAEILSESGIDESILSLKSAALSMRQLDFLIGATSRALGRQDIGLELGTRLGVHSHEAFSLALATCRTLEELFAMYARFWKYVTTCFSLECRQGAEWLEWIVWPAAGMTQQTLYAFEELFAVAFHSDCTRLLGGRTPIDIYLSMPTPEHLPRYDVFHPTRFHFSAHALPHVRCVVPARFAQAPLKMPKMQSPKDSSGDPPEVATTKRCGAWIELMLREAEGTQPSREALAHLLGVSPRTLTRNLAAEGINLRKLGNEIRYARACSMLAIHNQPVTQIAFRLGYKDVTSFNHAFRSIAGMNPRTYRKTRLFEN